MYKVTVLLRKFDEKSEAMLRAAGFDVCVYNDSLDFDDEQIYEAAKDADAMIVSVQPIRRSLIERLVNLKVLVRRGLGFDNIDTDACKECNISFYRTDGVIESSVAEQVIAYIMYFARRVEKQSNMLKSSGWQRSVWIGAEGKTLGLIGWGGIGQQISKRAVSLGMRVIATSHHHALGECIDGVEILAENEVLGQSDFVSINIPLRQDTYHYANDTFFERMKRGSYFINTARGGVMDENALIRHLHNNHLAGCAVDVFENEPRNNSELFHFDDRVIVTPHSSTHTEQTQMHMNYKAAELIVNFFENHR